MSRQRHQVIANYRITKPIWVNIYPATREFSRSVGTHQTSRKLSIAAATENALYRIKIIPKVKS